MCFLFTKYSLRGLFDWSKPWRFIAMFLTVGACCLSGFRTVMVGLILLFVIQFYLEGLFRTRMLPIMVAVAIFSFIPVLFFAQSMPGPVQRAISFLPIEVSSEVLSEAKSSQEWRFEMWDAVSKQVPKYLIIGKGYSINPDEIFAINEAARVGESVNSYEGVMLAGDYHNGPLSVIVPFGLPGVIGFLWLLASGYRVLSRNYRFGDVQLRRINRALLTCFLTNCFCFFFLFGALSTELSVFTGLCGFSVCLNGGIRRRVAPKPMPAPVTHALAMDPG
jgi:O-antigen ligase